jgi:metallo-beta-lactamase family protein
VMIVHGEDGVKESFREFLRNEIAADALIPKPGDRLDLFSNELHRAE